MNSSNPVLNRAYSQRGYAAMNTVPELEESFNAPAASSLRTGRMTMDDVVARTAILLGTAVFVGAAAWFLNLPPAFLFVGFIGGLVTGLIGAFSKKVRPALYVTYAVFQGLVLGILSKTYELFYPGIVQQAVVATIAAFVGMLFMYKSGRLRATPKFTKVLLGGGRCNRELLLDIGFRCCRTRCSHGSPTRRVLARWFWPRNDCGLALP